MSLRTCSTCQRLVRSGATACPFCATALAPLPTALPSSAPLARRARAVLLAGSIGVGVAGVAACEKESGPPPQVAPQPAMTETAIPPQAPPPATGTATAPAPTSPEPTAVAMYGAPPPPKK